MQHSTAWRGTVLRGLGALLLSEMLCLFLSFTCAALAVGFPAEKALSVLCTVGIYIGILIDFGNKEAKRNANKGWHSCLAGLICAVPALLLWGGLLLARQTGLDAFLTAYRFLNAPFFQILTTVCGTRTLSQLPMGVLFGFATLALVPFVTVNVAYQATLRGETK